MTTSAMGCPSVEELQCVIEGHGSEELRAMVERHLDDCESCVRRFDEFAGSSLTESISSPVPEVLHNVAVEEASIGSDERMFLDRLKCSFRIDDPQMIGPYRVLGRIGQGAMGDVYECADDRLNRRAAVKTIRSHLSEIEILQRFAIEARAQAGLNHPNIVQLYDSGTTPEGLPFLVMEMVEGGTLKDRLKCGRLSPPIAAQLVRDCAEALDYAHERGVLHRDLKPSNILLAGPESQERQHTTPADTPVPKIADFGLARSFDGETHVTLSGSVVGTPGYMAPEQIRSGSRLGRQADIYSLGVVLYESLTGAVPFKGETLASTIREIEESPPRSPRKIDHEIPRDLETICLKCLEKRPEDRYVSGRALAEDLNRYLEGSTIWARPVPWTTQMSRWCRRNPFLASSLGASLLLLTVMTVGSLSFAWKQAELRSQAEVARSEAEDSRAESERMARAAERGESEAKRQRDLSSQIFMNSARLMAMNFYSLHRPEVMNSPTLKKTWNLNVWNFFLLVDNALGPDGIDNLDPVFRIEILYKSAAIHKMSGDLDKCREKCEEIERLAHELPESIARSDKVASWRISTSVILSELEIANGFNQSDMKILRQSWDEWHGLGETWLRANPAATFTLGNLGTKLVEKLKKLDRNEDAAIISRELDSLARYVQDAGMRTVLTK